MKSPAISEEDKKYRAEHDLRTLIEGEKIRADKPRLRLAMAEKKRMQEDLAKVEGK